MVVHTVQTTVQKRLILVTILSAVLVCRGLNWFVFITALYWETQVFAGKKHLFSDLY